MPEGLSFLIDPLSMISGIANTVQGTKNTNRTNLTNIMLTRETNKANERMTRETNESNERMNAENNQTQIDLAEKAYQRSTASNQIAELVKAGYSELQARQIVAGSGSSPSMPMPTTTAATDIAPQNVAPTVEPFLPNMNLGSSGNLFGQLAQDLVSENGGAFGNMIAASAITELQNIYDNNPDLFPDESVLTSPESLIKYAKSLPEDHELQKFINGSNWKKVRHSLVGSRAFLANTRLVYRNNMDWATHRILGEQAIKRGEYAQKLDEIHITREQIAQELDQGTLDRFNFTKQASFDADLAAFQKNLAESLRDKFLLENEEYKKLYVERILAEESNRKFVALIGDLKNRGMYENLENVPASIRQFAQMYSYLGEMGVTDDIYKVAIASMVNPDVAVDVLNFTANATLSGAASAIKWTAEGASTLFNGAKDYAGELWDKTKDKFTPDFLRKK